MSCRLTELLYRSMSMGSDSLTCVLVSTFGGKETTAGSVSVWQVAGASATASALRFSAVMFRFRVVITCAPANSRGLRILASYGDQIDKMGVQRLTTVKFVSVADDWLSTLSLIAFTLD
eukprot:2224191-Prymnesium_polylepis.1